MLSLEPAILQRLTDLAPAGVRVLPAPDLAAIAEEPQVTPAIRLVFDGYRVLEAVHPRRRGERPGISRSGP